MILIIGLGNPGKKYEKTRHNIGFVLADKAISNFQFPISKQSASWRTKFKSQISKGEVGGQTVMIAKPQTFMNKSGEAVAALVHFYRIPPEKIWVIHDDLDLPLGTIKIQKGRSAAGHKGVQSIIDHLGTKDFVRFRIGIAPLKPTRQDGADFVLSKFSKEEEKKLKDVLERAGEAVETMIFQEIQP